LRTGMDLPCSPVRPHRPRDHDGKVDPLMSTRKQKLRAAAAEPVLGEPARAEKKVGKVKKTSRGK